MIPPCDITGPVRRARSPRTGSTHEATGPADPGVSDRDHALNRTISIARAELGLGPGLPGHDNGLSID